MGHGSVILRMAACFMIIWYYGSVLCMVLAIVKLYSMISLFLCICSVPMC